MTGGGGRAFDSQDLVFRRVPHWQVVPTDDGPRASGQAFDNDGDGFPMSAYADPLLREHGLGRAQTLDDHPDGEFFVTAVRVETLTAEEQQVVPDPIVPQVHVCDPAHVAVVGDKPTKRRRRIARTSRWVPGLDPGGGQMLEEGE